MACIFRSTTNIFWRVVSISELAAGDEFGLHSNDENIPGISSKQLDTFGCEPVDLSPCHQWKKGDVVSEPHSSVQLQFFQHLQLCVFLLFGELVQFEHMEAPVCCLGKSSSHKH